MLPLAAGDLSFNPGITQEDFHTFSLLAAQAIFATPVEPPRAAGLLSFDVGVAASAIKIDKNADFWRHSVSSDLITVNYLAVPRLVVSKGLAGSTIAGSYARFSNTSAKVYGASYDFPVVNGNLARPTLAGRLSYATVRGLQQLDLRTWGLEFFFSKGIGPFTPYVAAGKMHSTSKASIPLPAGAPSPTLVLNDKSNLTRYTLGMRVSLTLPKLTVEATQADRRSYAAKISIGF